MADTHHLVKTILIPQVAELLMKNKGLSEDEALKKIYESPVAKLLEDDSMGLYGQSALYLYGLIEEDSFEKQQFETEIYLKLKEAEKQEALLNKRYSSKEVLDQLKQESSNSHFERISPPVNISSEQILSALSESREEK